MLLVFLKDSFVGLPALSMHSWVINRRAVSRSGTLFAMYLRLKIALSPRSPCGLMVSGKMSTYSFTPHFSLVALIAASRLV
jgi:hypothetical protein